MSIQDSYLEYARCRHEFTKLILKRYTGTHKEEIILQAIGGSLKFADAYVLQRYLQQHKPATILEIGSFLGFSTHWLLKSSSPWTASVTAVDPNIRHRIFDEPRTIVERFNAPYLGQRLRIITAFLGEFGNSLDWHYKTEFENDPSFRDAIMSKRPILDDKWNEKFDFIFIDGDHEYKSARNNFEICLNLINSDGVIAFHDAITWQGVARLMKELKEDYSETAFVEVLHAGNVFDHPLLSKEPVQDVDGIGIFKWKSVPA